MMQIIIISIFSRIILSQTTTTTCQNDPLVYKLDLRDYINQLGPFSMISDIDPQALCQLVQDYDYVWLTQMWTPSIFSFQNNANPEQAQDYRITMNIKEYTLDPTLGSTQDLISLKQSLNQICYHTKFLGEFSFYIGKDSSLIQNNTRFLKIPFDQVSRFYNPRYDKDGFVWAVDDFGRTIPNSAVWNLFSQTVITDIKDIIYRQILTQYNLDGIVFLQPSLGLYSFNTYFYQSEVSYYGQSGYLNDFYVNFGLKNTIQTYFFMGGEDNLNLQQNLTNQGLQLIFTPQVNNYDRTWALVNFTFDTIHHQNCVDVSDITVSRQYTAGTPFVVGAFVNQALPQTQKSCFRLIPKKFSYTTIGLGIKSTMTSRSYVIDIENNNFAVIGISDRNIFNFEDHTLDKSSVAFNYSVGDEIEIQYDPINSTIVFKKFLSNLRYQMQILAQPQTLQYVVILGNNTPNYLIQFPFKFSTVLKSSSSTVNDDRNLTVNSNTTLLRFAQIVPSLNLLNITTLNIQIKKIPTNQIVGVGVCNQELMRINQHTWDPTKSGSGAYMILSNGKTLNSESSYNGFQTIFSYSQGATISITYYPGQRLQFYDNVSKYNNVTVSKYIRNVNFCVAFTTINSAFYLNY